MSYRLYVRCRKPGTVKLHNLPARLNRWIPAAALMLVSTLSYVDRNTLALLAPSILRDTHLSASDYGWAVSAYSLLFALSNPAWGKLLDRIGVRAGMTAAVALWSVASVSHVFARGLYAFAGARALLGLGEGAAAPGGLRTVVQTLPGASRARGMALTYSGGSLGAILTPFLMTPVALRWGWRAAFWFTGMLGAAWILMWALISRRADVRQMPPGTVRSAARSPGFGDLRLWAYLLAYSLGALPLGFVVYSQSIYLNRALGISQKVIGAVFWLAPLGSEIGVFFWGWLADRLSVSGQSKLPVVRRLLPVAMLLSLPLAFTARAGTFAATVAHLCFAMFVAAAYQILALVYGTEVYSRDFSGYLGGIASGSYGAGLALLMPLFGRLFDLHAYSAAFALASACPVLGYFGWFLLDMKFQQQQDEAQQ